MKKGMSRRDFLRNASKATLGAAALSGLSTTAHASVVGSDDEVKGEIETLSVAQSKVPAIHDSSAADVDLDIADESGNVILRLQNGHIKTKLFDSENLDNGTCYVAPDGSDDNSGSASSAPFATFQHAIDAGYKKIIAAPGEYKNQTVTIEGKNGISIICHTNTKESSVFDSHQRQARAKLDNSIDIGELTDYEAIYRAALTVDRDSSYYKVFIDQTMDPVYSEANGIERVSTYNAILWEITDSVKTCARLAPKLTLAECEATAGTFFFDGDYLYVNPTDGSMTGKTYKRLNKETAAAAPCGFCISNSTDIYIEGLDIQFFPYRDFDANLVTGLTMRDCGFYFTCYGSAAVFDWCNGDMVSCRAAQAGADGFSVSEGGNTCFYDCSAVRCDGDGISHHDGSTGVIDGGHWTGCLKGGVTPSFGAKVTVKNVICEENLYGIYYTQGSGRTTDAVLMMQNCLAVENTGKDIKISGYNVVSHGCAYGTKEVDSEGSLTEYGNTVIQ